MKTLDIIDADGNVVDQAAPAKAQAVLDAWQRRTRQPHTIRDVDDTIDLRDKRTVRAEAHSR